MLRVWPLVLALAAACKGDPAAGDPDQPAGKVIELSGKVDATREGAAVRPLVVGAPVFADDTVTTGPDGSAVILLAHNQVRWSLGQDKSLRVDRSMAWKASGDESGSAFDDEEKVATASAGRHTDREAADTAATAQLPGAAEPEAPPAPPAQSSEAMASSSKPTSGSAAKRSRSASGSASKTLAQRPAPADSDDRLLDEPSGGGGAASGAATAAVPAAPAPPAGSAVVPGKLTVKGALAADQVGPRLADFAGSCRGSVAGKLVVRIEIDGKGAVKSVRLIGSSKVTASIAGCVSAAARGLSFPAASGSTTVERELTVPPVR